MSSQRSGSKYSRGFISQWIGGYCGRPCIGTDRLLCHICMASALTVKPDRSNRNRKDTPSIAIAMGGELHKSLICFLQCAFGLMLGTELVFSRLRSYGKALVITTLTQSLGTFVVVSLVFALVFAAKGVPVFLAPVLGSIALATAPAPALSVVREFHTKGPVTDTLLPMAVFDDVVGIVVFLRSTPSRHAGPLAALRVCVCFPVGGSLCSPLSLGPGSSVALSLGNPLQSSSPLPPPSPWAWPLPPPGKLLNSPVRRRTPSSSPGGCPYFAVDLKQPGRTAPLRPPPARHLVQPPPYCVKGFSFIKSRLFNLAVLNE